MDIITLRAILDRLTAIHATSQLVFNIAATELAAARKCTASK